MKNSVVSDVNVEISELLKEALADMFVLSSKSKNYHWNVTGEHFEYLHLQFEKLYNELALDADVIAERIRILGQKAPGTLQEFLAISSIKEEPGKYPEYREMVNNLSKDLEIISVKLYDFGKKAQNEYDDEITAGILFGLVEKYQKTNWMLKSFLNR